MRVGESDTRLAGAGGLVLLGGFFAFSINPRIGLILLSSGAALVALGVAFYARPAAAFLRGGA